jgi:hypothetical protein
LVKIPRRSSKSEILQEVYQEWIGSSNLSNPAVVSSSVVSLEKLKEVTVRLS